MFIKYRAVNAGGPCNFNCRTCEHKENLSARVCTEELTSRLLSISESENIEFTGGDFFMRNDMAAIADLASKRFRRVKYNTNGAVFAYKEQLEKAVSSGVKIIFFKFFSIDRETHAKMTNKDALMFALQGFENLVERQNVIRSQYPSNWECDFFLAANLVAHSATMHSLERSADYLSLKNIGRIVIDFRLSDCASDEALATARRCVEKCAQNGSWAVIKGIPVCAARGFEEHCGDVYRTENAVPGNVLLPGVCESCVLRSRCGGVPATLADKRRWTPICASNAITYIDKMQYFHSHIPERDVVADSGRKS